MISGGSSVTQTSSHVKSFELEDRKKIVDNLKMRVLVPATEIAAMKSCLNISRNKLREISRWLKCFDIKIASEKETRKTTKEWTGTDLHCELAPLTVRSASNLTVDLRP